MARKTTIAPASKSLVETLGVKANTKQDEAANAYETALALRARADVQEKVAAEAQKHANAIEQALVILQEAGVTV